MASDTHVIVHESSGLMGLSRSLAIASNTLGIPLALTLEGAPESCKVIIIAGEKHDASVQLQAFIAENKARVSVVSAQWLRDSVGQGSLADT